MSRKLTEEQHSDRSRRGSAADPRPPTGASDTIGRTIRESSVAPRRHNMSASPAHAQAAASTNSQLAHAHAPMAHQSQSQLGSAAAARGGLSGPSNASKPPYAPASTASGGFHAPASTATGGFHAPASTAAGGFHAPAGTAAGGLYTHGASPPASVHSAPAAVLHHPYGSGSHAVPTDAGALTQQNYAIPSQVYAANAVAPPHYHQAQGNAYYSRFSAAQATASRPSTATVPPAMPTTAARHVNIPAAAVGARSHPLVAGLTQAAAPRGAHSSISYPVGAQYSYSATGGQGPPRPPSSRPPNSQLAGQPHTSSSRHSTQAAPSSQATATELSLAQIELQTHKDLANEFRSRISTLEAQNGKLRAENETLRHRSELAEALRDPDSDAETLRKHNAKLRAEVARLQAEAEERAGAETEAAEAKAEEELEARVAELEREAADLSRQLRDAKEEIASHDADEERLETSLRKAYEETRAYQLAEAKKQHKLELDAVKLKLRAKERRIEELRERMDSEVSDEVKELRQERDEYRQKLREQHKRYDRLMLGSDEDDLRDEIKEKDAEIARLRKRATEAESSIAKANEDLADRTAELSAAQRERDELRSEMLSMRPERSSGPSTAIMKSGPKALADASDTGRRAAARNDDDKKKSFDIDAYLDCDRSRDRSEVRNSDRGLGSRDLNRGRERDSRSQGRSRGRERDSRRSSASSDRSRSSRRRRRRQGAYLDSSSSPARAPRRRRSRSSSRSSSLNRHRPPESSPKSSTAGPVPKRRAEDRQKAGRVVSDELSREEIVESVDFRSRPDRPDALFKLDSSKVGMFLGKGGCFIDKLRLATKCKIWVPPRASWFAEAPERLVEVQGPREGVHRVREEIALLEGVEVAIANPEESSELPLPLAASAPVAARQTEGTGLQVQEPDAVFHVSSSTMGKLVGHKLASLDELRAESGCQIWCELGGSAYSARPDMRRIDVRGPPDGIELVRRRIAALQAPRGGELASAGVDPARLLMLPNDDSMGRVIGPSGAKMREIEAWSRCRIWRLNPKVPRTGSCILAIFPSGGTSADREQRDAIGGVGASFEPEFDAAGQKVCAPVASAARAEWEIRELLGALGGANDQSGATVSRLIHIADILENKVDASYVKKLKKHFKSKSNSIKISRKTFEDLPQPGLARDSLRWNVFVKVSRATLDVCDEIEAKLNRLLLRTQKEVEDAENSSHASSSSPSSRAKKPSRRSSLRRKRRAN